MDLKNLMNPSSKSEVPPPSNSPTTPTATYRATPTPTSALDGSSDYSRDNGIEASPRTTPTDLKRKRLSDVEQLPPAKKRPTEPSQALAPPPKPRPQQPTRQRFKEPPIWAQRCRATYPLKKYQNQIGKQTPAPQLQTAVPPSAARPPAQPQAKADETVADDFAPTFNYILPVDDITKAVGDWLAIHVVSNHTFDGVNTDTAPLASGGLEIEAKIGRLIDRRTESRLNLGLATETVLIEGVHDIAFESSMTEGTFIAFNNNFNEAVCKSRTDMHPKTGKPKTPIGYKHLRETDSFYELPDQELAGLPGAVRELLHHKKPKVRITRDAQSGQVGARIVKSRIADIQVHCPRANFDYRISVNLEMNWSGNVGPSSSPDRTKDRLSYDHSSFHYDLTKVTSNNALGSHELEVELDASMVMQQGKLLIERQPNKYNELIKGFLDNVRLLSQVKTQPAA